MSENNGIILKLENVWPVENGKDLLANISVGVYDGPTDILLTKLGFRIVKDDKNIVAYAADHNFEGDYQKNFFPTKIFKKQVVKLYEKNKDKIENK